MKRTRGDTPIMNLRVFGTSGITSSNARWYNYGAPKRAVAKIRS